MTPRILVPNDRNTYRNETDTAAKTLAHSSRPARVPRLHNDCELNFLLIYCFLNFFSLSVFRLKKNKTKKNTDLR